MPLDLSYPLQLAKRQMDDKPELLQSYNTKKSCQSGCGAAQVT